MFYSFVNKPTFNPELDFIINDWEGNSINELGRYTNLYGDDIRTLMDVIKWRFGPRPLARLKKNQKSPLSFNFIQDIQNKNQDSIIPLGHAGFIIDLKQKRFVIDPFIIQNPLLKMHTPIPVENHQILDVDYLLLSHNHRDHIDKESIKLICRLNPESIILTGLEIGRMLRRWNITNPIQEAGWFQKYNTDSFFEIAYLPTQHWSRRWLRDTNQHLWGSFIIKDNSSDQCIYYGSDSGYDQHFKLIGSLYNIDIAILGIGACEPRWFMKSYHMNPEDALTAFDDLKAKKWMPMHYGTFDLSDEPIYYPEQVLRTEFANKLDNIIWMKIGERIILTQFIYQIIQIILNSKENFLII